MVVGTFLPVFFKPTFEDTGIGVADRYVVVISLATESKLLEAERAAAAIVDILDIGGGGGEGGQGAESSSIHPGDRVEHCSDPRSGPRS